MSDRPTSLFKYRRWAPTPKRRPDGTWGEINYTAQLLRDRAFFCQTPWDFDDPHDGHTGPIPTGGDIDIDRFVIEKMSPVIAVMKSKGFTSLTQLGKSNDPEEAAALSHVAGQERRKNFYVLCLSTTCRDELMWSFYADSHKGICLEFDATAACFAGARLVTYGARPPSAAKGDDLVYAKSEAWHFQQECRLVTPNRIHAFPPEALRSVTLGYRFPEAGYAAVKNALVDGGYHVVIGQMQRPVNSYALVPVERERT